MVRGTVGRCSGLACQTPALLLFQESESSEELKLFFFFFFLFSLPVTFSEDPKQDLQFFHRQPEEMNSFIS